MTIGNSICFACELFTRYNAETPKAHCQAFPGGIPDAILVNGFDHRKPYPHDMGIRFRLDSQAKLDAYESIAGIAK